MLLGLDMGGTNTDAVIIRDRRVVAYVKVPSRQDAPEASIVEALQELFNVAKIKPGTIARATFGSTLAVNAILQKKYDSVGLALAAGPGINPLWSTIGENTFLASAKLDHRGAELSSFEPQPFKNQVRLWKNQGINRFACVTKFSTRNPLHENLMGKILQEAFSNEAEQPLISQGHWFSDSLNFPRRVTAAYWNGAVWRIHNDFSAAIQKTLRQLGVTAPTFFLKADGGTAPLTSPIFRPIEAAYSGPAASVMGLLALCPTQEDCFTLDMGGTTTDIALLVRGRPLLAPQGLVIERRPSLVRALLSHSTPIGGDSCVTVLRSKKGIEVRVGPNRLGPAMAFGGTNPTLMDCLNIQTHAGLGNAEASLLGLKRLSEQCGLPVLEIAKKALRAMKERLSEAMDELLLLVNNQPAYTLEALLNRRAVQPTKCVLTGGPSKHVAPILQEALTIPVTTPGAHYLTTNAIGAALAKPTAKLDLFASTEKGFCMIPSLEVKYAISKNYSLEQAQEDAAKYLYKTLAQTDPTSTPQIDAISAQSFSVISPSGQSFKEHRVSCQVRPSLEHTLL